MDTTRQTSDYLTQLLVVIAAVFAVFGIFTVRAYMADPVIFDFRFNAYALISIVSAVVSLVCLWYVSRTNVRGAEAVWFYIFLSCLFLYSVFETFQRLSANPEGAAFWARFLGLAVLEPAALYIFALTYLNVKVRNIRIIAIILLSAVLLFFFHANGNAIYQNDLAAIKEYPWGFNNDIGPGFLLHLLWILGVGAATVTLFVKYLRSAKNTVLKKQAKLFLLAMILPAVAGIVTEVIAPIFNDGQPTLVPLHAAFGTFTAGLMLWGLKRYHAFRVSPAQISGEILSLMNETVVVVNKDLKIEFFNKETTDRLTGEARDYHGASIMSFLDKQSGEALKKGIDELQEKGTVLLDDMVIDSGVTEKVYARFALSAIPEESGVDGYIVVITDVTELKKSYDALEAEKASVEHVVEIRTRELQEARDRLLETDKLKTEFVMLTSHNLRTPLTIVKGNLELLKLPNVKDEDKSTFLASAEESATKLGELVEDLLTISNIEAGGSLALEDISISEIITPLITEMETLSSNNNNKFISHIDVGGYKVPANANRLRAGIRNVLENASKFTRDGSIVFTAKVIEDKLVLTVKDTGIGIAPQEIPNLFTKFHRATDAMQYDYDGEGIGLYLSKLIIEDHQGTISVESKEHEGTTVTLTLPIIKAPTPPER